MASRLPAFPRFVFTVFEPISLLLGAVPAITSPGWFISEQLSSAVPLVSSPNANLVAQQLGNGFGMAFMMAFAILYASTELNVIRNYLIALWVADIGHVGLTLYALGWDGSLDFANWNPMTWGNVAVTTFLFLTRTIYLVGGFGPDAPLSRTKKSQ